MVLCFFWQFSGSVVMWQLTIFWFFVGSGKICVIWLSEFGIKGRGKSLWEIQCAECALYGLASYSLIYKKGILLLLFFILLPSQPHPFSLSLTSILITGKIDFLLHVSSQDRLTRAQRPQRPSLPAETTLDQFISSWLVDSYNSVNHLSWSQLCLARSKRIC